MRGFLKGLLGLLGFIVANAIIFKVVFELIDLRHDTSAKKITIGSKAFTESIVLAELMAELIERRTDLRVVRRTNLGGTHICFQALLSGEIDLYPEYTGTGLMAILGRPVESDPAKTLDIVRDAFASQYALIWLEPLSFNNTYALAMTEKLAVRLGVRTISDLRHHPELRVGFTAEFMARKDGYPGLMKRYGLSFAKEPSSMEAGLMYSAAADEKVDLISAYATDGRIDKFALRVLADDLGFFPPYQAAPLVRAATLEQHPELRQVLGVLSGKLTDAEMRKINATVDIDGKAPEVVAKEYADKLSAAQ